MASSPNVLRVNPVAEQTAYRAAVSRILVDIQAEHHCTLLAIAALTALKMRCNSIRGLAA